MYNFKAYAMRKDHANIAPLPVNRKWMDDMLGGEHGFEGIYRCFPMGLANQMGYGISFPDDISFEWDGVYDGEREGIKIHAGHKWIHKNRGWATLSLNTYTRLVTDENTSMLSFPVPNEFYDGYQIYTTLLSTSFYKGFWEVTLRLTKPNEIITIPANTPIGAIMPISLGHLNETTMTHEFAPPEMLNDFVSKEENAYIEERTKNGQGTGFYRRGINIHGKVYGKHEVSKINLNVDNKLIN